MNTLNGYKKVIICDGVKIGKNDFVPGNRTGCSTCRHAGRAKIKAIPDISEEESRSMALNTSRHLNGADNLHSLEF